MFRSTVLRAGVLVCAVVLSLGLAALSQAQEGVADAGALAPQAKSGCPVQNRSFLQSCNSKIPDVSGTYTGVVNDSFSGPGTITLSVAQKQQKITGLWSTSFPNGTGQNGNLSGTVSKTAIKGKLGTRVPKCFYHVIATITADKFQGTFADFGRCPQEDSGTFTIDRKQ